MNMLLWTSHVTEQHFPIIEQLKLTGYDGIELPLGEGNAAHYSALGNHLRGMELGVTAVTSLLEDTNIASPDPAIRQAGLDRLKWTVDMKSYVAPSIPHSPISHGSLLLKMR